ncbi:hypothetical protein QTL95_27350 [Rhizobium sp. S152]|uniref:hypothetical protein n=1 Tax=Rhizobium sp. S152 TaxID=3055038 RepID=UPI0025A95922|nr:hypothetical protein [Rhizobium sp. S152]MDM9629605.1 hypothetical protein [Rhizobium sp. S152]
MTSVSSLGSSSSSSAYISSLDKNGDGIISADELAAANTTSTTTKSSTSTASGSDSASVTQKIAADILAMMLQIQQSGGSDDSGDDGSDDDSKGILAALDTNGDGKLTSDEVLSADPSKIAASADGDDETIIAEVLTDMQTALRAYQNTYGTSPAADSGSEDVQTA